MPKYEDFAALQRDLDRGTLNDDPFSDGEELEDDDIRLLDLMPRAVRSTVRSTKKAARVPTKTVPRKILKTKAKKKK